MFSGVFKCENLSLLNQLRKNLDQGRTLIRYKPDSNFYIVCESSNKLYTYKNQFRMYENKELRYLEATTPEINPDLYTVKLKSCTYAEGKHIRTFHSINNVPYTMESYKIGH